MASKCLSFFYVVLVVLLIADAKEIKVGDTQGWQQPEVNHTYLYSLWASRIKFYVGDSLRFEYKDDSVLVVDKWAYYHCNLSNPISLFKDEITVISLDNPGPIYFVSGDSGHCERGQKLLVDVLELHPKSPPSGTPAEMSPAPSPHSSSGIQVSSETIFPASMASFLALVIAFTMYVAGGFGIS